MIAMISCHISKAVNAMSASQHTRVCESVRMHTCVGFHGKATLHSSAKLIKTAKNLVQLVHLVWLTIARQHNTQMHESRHTHTCNFRFIVTRPLSQQQVSAENKRTEEQRGSGSMRAGAHTLASCTRAQGRAQGLRVAGGSIERERTR